MKRLIVSLLLTMLPLAAQTSSLQGVVTDAQGAVVPAAAITVTNTETNTPRSSLTDESGKYSLLQMPPGSYKMQVQAPGFSVFTSEIRLQINTPTTLNVKLELGQTTETVNVTAEAVAINKIGRAHV